MCEDSCEIDDDEGLWGMSVKQLPSIFFLVGNEQLASPLGTLSLKNFYGIVHAYQPFLIPKGEFHDFKGGDLGLKGEIFSAMNLTVEFFTI